jgi:hypothetical protein
MVCCGSKLAEHRPWREGPVHSGQRTKIGLAGGLGFGSLTFDGSNIIADGETLATLAGVDATTLDEFDFIVI